MDKRSKNILVVDDEAKITEVVSAFLESHGYHVFTAKNGKQALDIFDKENILLIVLDLMLPDITGEDICRIIRQKSRVPIVMLTAKAGEEDLLQGLSLGADDYITKPFSLKALHARIEAVLRRASDDLVPLTMKNSWRNGDFIIDLEKNIVKIKQKPVNLTASEFKILSAFIKYPGRVFTRGELIDLVFGDDFDGFDRAIDTHIKNLRQKLGDNPKEPKYIITIHRVGYKFGGE